jgi:spermidine/putrescine transport system ATP-binding protein
MLEVRDIWKDYERKPLLCGVSFTVEPGEVVCLLGASGSGKSTLLRIISGLEGARSGQVLWQGRDLANVPVHRRNFGLMFQDYALFPHRSVAENVAFGMRMQGVARSEIRSRVGEALRSVNMDPFANRRVTDLSGGEQQRVALARALAPRPRLLMLDEPLGALDRTLKEQVAEELRRILHAAEIPAIYVTHDQEEAFAIADRLVLLNDGQVVQSGAPAEVYERPVSPWAARFLGLSNLLPGRIVETAPLQAETELGTLQGMWNYSSSPRVGEQVMLLLRPFGLTLDPSDGQPNILQGQVEDSVFRGDGFRLNMRMKNDQELSFFVHRDFTPGSEVRIALDEVSVQFLREEE